MQVVLSQIKSAISFSFFSLKTEVRIFIYIYLSNIGIMACPELKTEDGLEMQMGTNHFGHFLLTEMLLPLLRKSTASGFTPR